MFKKKNGFRVLSILLLVVFFLLIFMLLFFLMAEVGKKDGLTIGLGLIGNVLGGLIGGGFTLLAIGETIKQNKRVAEIEKIPDKLILLEDMRNELFKHQNNLVNRMDILEEGKIPDDNAVEILIKELMSALSTLKKQSMQINKGFYKTANACIEDTRLKLLSLDFGLPSIMKEIERENNIYEEIEGEMVKSSHHQAIVESKISGLWNKLSLVDYDLENFGRVIKEEMGKYEDNFFEKSE